MIDWRTDTFKSKYNWPKEAGVKSLFRFYNFDLKKLDYIKTLFVDKKLFHNTPEDFNDPFECKPHFQWPTTAEENGAFIQDVITIMTLQGVPYEEAMYVGIKALRDQSLKDELANALVTKLQMFRICCFTTRKENLLFWSHYAESHKGYCVEFDTKYPLFEQAYKVNYSQSYPMLKFPLFSDLAKFAQVRNGADIERAIKDLEIEFSIVEPALNKSEEWHYEEEYRSLIMPKAMWQVENDGHCAALRGDEIKNVYFGCRMPEDHKEKLIQIISEGPFKPNFWQAKICSDKFALTFERLTR